jgi:O-antigen/teichoic acid export membrane protein
MDGRANVFRNTLALAVPNVLNPLISFLLILVISRYRGVTGLGQYSLVMAYLGIFGTLASLGLADLVVREVARNRERLHAFLFNAGLFGAITSVVSLAAMNLMVVAMGYESDLIRACFIASLSLLASTAITYLEAIFRSVERSKHIAFAFVVENSIKVAACVVLLLKGYGIPSLFVVVLATRFLCLSILTYSYIRVLGKPGCSLDPEIWRILAREAPTFTSIAIFSTIHLSLDSIMLSKLKSLDSVGIYSAADRLLAICKTFPIAFASALLPFFTRARLGGLKDLQGEVQNTLRYLMALLIPIVIGTMVLANDFILMIYGAKFAGAGQVLRYHIISLLPFSTVFLLAQVLISTDNQRIDLIINIVAALVNFVLNFMLIPRFAEMGAVIATLTSIVIFNQLQYIYLKKFLFPLSFFSIAYKPLVAAVGMGIVTYLLRDFNLLLSVAVSAIIYGALLLMLKAITYEELIFLASFVRGASKEGPSESS